jgi:nucleoside-diphosphate-sugar epimerase
VTETITITGGSGYVGQLLRRRLSRRDYRVRVLDPYRGVLVDVLRRRYLGGATAPTASRLALRIRATQQPTERALTRLHIIRRRRRDDIRGPRERLAARFAGSHAVVHLAGIPHPFWPGATPEDFIAINYEAAVNVFEAAREAGAAVFVFASSAQVYRINDPVRVTQFPILEDEYLPLPAEGQTLYGHLKAAVERYLAGACHAGGIQAVALRLEYPGFRSRGPENLFVSTSVENLVRGFTRALHPPDSLRFEAFNIADEWVDPAIVNIQEYLAQSWAHVPNRTSGNQTLLSIEKARRILGFEPFAGGTYLDERLVW